jgi:hypothetical protein
MPQSGVEYLWYIKVVFSSLKIDILILEELADEVRAD